METKFVPKIDRTCPQKWSGMQGDEKRRFCEQCQLFVHNLSAMSAVERRDVLGDISVRKCVAYDITESQIRIRAHWWVWLQRLLRPWQAGIALWAMLLAPFAVNEAQAKVTPQKTQQCRPARDGKDFGDFKLGGAIEPCRPLWRRILFFWERY